MTSSSSSSSSALIKKILYPINDTEARTMEANEVLKKSSAKDLVTTHCIFEWRNKVLIIQKWSEASFDALLWEIPGGKLEQHERVLETIRREVGEEVSFGFDDTKSLKPYTFKDRFITRGDREGQRQLQLYFFCHLDPSKSEPRVSLDNEHIAYKWANWNEIDELDFMPLVKETIFERLLMGMT